ncbi:MAG: EAL domain-containing protein [Dehalococcoidia bacterium]
MEAAAVGAQPTGTILVVDDEASVRALFARTLRDAGYAVLEATDGIEAIELLDSHGVALVLLDSTMPRLGGLGVIRELRRRPATRTLPIILVTAKAELEDRVLGLAAGADDYLAKPVALDELQARVQAQLRSHAAWIETSEREAAQRRAMTAILRRVRTGDSAEHAAGAIVAELLPVLGVDALALASVQPDGSIVPLAASGSWSDEVRPGIPIEQALARRLREHLADGPWVVELGSNGVGRRPAGGVAVALPLDGPDGPFGVLVVRVDSGRRGPRDIARRLPLLLQLADLTAPALRELVEAGGTQLQRRAALKAVISDRAFQPHFQPVVALADRAVFGYEALTRFADGTPPDRVFAEAARLGLGRELERATLAAAVGAARNLPAAALLGLNVSPAFVLSGDLPDILAYADRPVVIELTEHAPIEDYAAVKAALARVQPPVEVAVDDAGSGYASLRHILALKPAYVKLDLSWIRDIDEDPARQSLVAGLSHFAGEVGCRLVGEGVETEAEAGTLLRLGVPLGQGYLFGRAAPAPPAAANEGWSDPDASPLG